VETGGHTSFISAGILLALLIAPSDLLRRIQTSFCYSCRIGEAEAPFHRHKNPNHIYTRKSAIANGIVRTPIQSILQVKSNRW